MLSNRTGSLQSASLQKNSGFTLIEIMVVVLILAILAAVVAPQLLSKPEEARIARSKSDIRSVNTTLGLYRMDNFAYPSTGDGLNSLVTKPSSASNKWKKYLDKVPLDPWGQEYKYRNPGTKGGEIDLYSLGPDRVPSDDDVGNWALD